MLRSCLALAVGMLAIYVSTHVAGEGNLKGEWSNWTDLSVCSAESCNCSGDVGKEVLCPDGEKAQIRDCTPAADGSWCSPDESDGYWFLRTIDCFNPTETCPGWGEWMPWSDCSDREIVRTRACDSPVPINVNNQCVGESLDAESVEDECAEEATTEQPATSTTANTENDTTGAPCDSDDVEKEFPEIYDEYSPDDFYVFACEMCPNSCNGTEN